MKNLYLIVSPDKNKATIANFKKSAKKLKIRVICISTEDFDFTKEYNLTKNDALYRISSSRIARTIEKILVNEDVKTLYRNNYNSLRQPYTVTSSNLTHKKHNLPIIPSIFSPSTKLEDLERYVDILGGFPIIIKVSGGSHGIGVMQIDSLHALKSTVDFLEQQKKEYILRKYIPHSFQPRLIVLGDNVIASVKYHREGKDFRQATHLEPFQFSTEIEQVAVDAVKTLGFQFGGVDVLIDTDGKPALAEVNFPCMFHGVQEITDCDITTYMLEFLQNKR